MFGLFWMHFFIGIPNIITKFQNVDMFYKICYILVLSSAHGRRIVSVKLIASRGMKLDIASYSILQPNIHHKLFVDPLL